MALELCVVVRGWRTVSNLWLDSWVRHSGSAAMSERLTFPQGKKCRAHTPGYPGAPVPQPGQPHAPFQCRHHGGRLQPVLMRHPPQLSVKTWGDGGWGGGSLGGGRLEGGGGGGVPRWGGLRATHYYHMHTSRGMCVWGFGGTEVCM